MEIPHCEIQLSLQQQDLQTFSPESCTPVSVADEAACLDRGQTILVDDTVSGDDPVSVRFRRTDLEDLPCWIGCIQLDHPYNSHTSLSGSGNFQSLAQHPADCHEEVTEPTAAGDVISCNRTVDPQCWRRLVDAKNCWVGLLDHAYESSSWESGSTGDHGHWDHAYNIQCSDDESPSIGRSVSVQHLDHSYDSCMTSELSYSETVLSSFLDHAYFASDLATGRRYTSGQRWSSSDDLHTVSRATPAFVW